MLEIKEVPDVPYQSNYKIIGEILIATQNILRTNRIISEFGESLKIFGDTLFLISDKFLDRTDQVGIRTYEMTRELSEVLNRIGISIIELSNKPNSQLDLRELELNITKFEWNIREHWNRIIDGYAATKAPIGP